MGFLDKIKATLGMDIPNPSLELFHSPQSAVLPGIPKKLPRQRASELDRMLNVLRTDTYRIGVFGEFGTGKSTFLNALMGEDILSVATEPTTAVATRIEWARSFNVFVYGRPTGLESIPPLVDSLFPEGGEPVWARLMKDGLLARLHNESRTIKDFLERWTKEGRDADKTHEVVIHLPQPFLKARISLIDTPGIGSEFNRHQKVTERVLPEVDLALCLIDAAQAGKRTEMEFIRHVATQAPLTRVLVHKIDRVEQSEREDLLDALMNTLQTFWPKDRGPVPEPWMASSLSVLDPIFGSKNPQLAAAFGHLREDLVGIAEEHRSQRILARNGSWDREHLDAAIEAEKAENLSEAHEQYIDLQTLYQELDCPVPVDVLEGIERVESQMMSATAQINEAHVLVDRVAALVLREEQPTEMTKDLIRQAGAIFYKANLRDMVFEKLGRQVLGNEVTKFLPEQTKDLDTISIPPQSERENSPSLDWFDRAEDPFHTLSFGVAHCRATASKMSRDFKVPRPWIKNDWETISCATNLALATESLNEFWGEQQNELQSEMIENLGTVINQLLESLMLTTAKNTSGSKFLFTLTQHEFAKIATVIEFMANENNNDTFSQISNSIIQYNNKCFLSIMDISKNNNKLIKFIELINEKEWDNKTINETAGDISFLGGEENSFEWLQDASYMELEPWSAFNSRSLESAARLAVLSEYLSDSTNIPDNRDISEDAKQLRTIADNIMVSQIKATANNTNGAMVDMVETQDHFSRLATEFENLSNNYTSVNFTAASNTITEINNALFDSLAECAKNNAFLANYLNEYHSNKSDGTNKTEPSNNNADPNKLYKCNSCGIMTYSPVIRSNCMTCPTCGRSY